MPRSRDRDEEYDGYGEEGEEEEYEDEEYEEDHGGGLSALEAGRVALEHIRLVSPRSVEGVTSVRRSREGWTVEIELLDARHVPSSADRLALYEVDLDQDGELTSYRRVAQYSRARGREAT